MKESVKAFQTAKVVCWSHIRKATGIAREVVMSITDAKGIF
jgi:hypothetical protein